MEAGRLLLRSLSDIPPGQRIGVLAEHYRANLVFLLQHGGSFDRDLRERFEELQGRLEEELRAQTPGRKADAARQLALRAWRMLIPPS